MKYVVHWVQCCLILHNIIIHFKSMLGWLSLVPWAQQEAQDLGRDHENVVVQVPIGSPSQLFHAGLMNSLFEVLGNVMVWGCDILFSIICLPPLLFDSPFTFTVSIMFFTNTFHYTVWWLISPFSLSLLTTNTYLLRWWLIISFPAYSFFHEIPACSMTWSVHRLWQYKYRVILYI